MLKGSVQCARCLVAGPCPCEVCAGTQLALSCAEAWSMQNSEAQPKIFVVLEAGVEWPLKLDFGGLTDVHIVAQQAQEPKLEFADRVAVRLARAQRSNGKVATTVFVVGSSLDDSAVEARCTIARTLAAALTWNPGSELTLTGKELSCECCAHLLALALLLEDELCDAIRVRIHAAPHGPVRAGRAAPRSGVFPRVDDASASGWRKAD